MRGGPMARDVDAPGHPDTASAADVVQQALQPTGPRRMADDSHMQANRQHLRLGRALAQQEIESVAAIRVEVVSGCEGTAAELRIVGRQAVWQDQMRLTLNLSPVRQIVIVSI